jgi:hypothetical protein
MIAIIASLILTTSIMLTVMPVQGQSNLPSGVTPTNSQDGGSILLPSGVTPDYSLDTTAYLSVRPNPIGVGQPFLVNIWIVPPLHVSHYLSGYTVTITKPDGTKDVKVLDSYRGDATAYFEEVADQVGSWTIKFDFPGGYFPPGNYTTYAGAAFATSANIVTSFTQSAYYKPSSSPEVTLTVQENIVMSWPPAPLPTDYWTRPVNEENREWWPILGNYPGTGYVGGGTVWDELYPDTNPHYSSPYSFAPWVLAPNSAHIVWRRQEIITGIIGGEAGDYGPASGAGSPMPSTPGLIYSGRCYQTVTEPGVGSVAQCYDLRTGEIYYEIPVSEGGVTPSIISYTHSYATISGMPAVPGGAAGAAFNVDLMSISGGQLMKIDPWTGALNVNVSISPLTGSGGTYYMNEYVLYVQNLGNSVPAAQRYRLINWTTAGSTDNFTARIISNTTYASSSLPSLIDFNAGMGATVSSITNTATGTPQQTQIMAYNLITGQQMWNTTVDEIGYSGGCNVADHGKIAVLMMDGYYKAWDLATGNLAWKSELMDYPWGQASFGAYSEQSAYGLIYREAYDGVYAFNWTNGKIAWHYEAPTPFEYETPYIDNGTDVYSFNAGGIVADGKLYTYNTEHTPSLPVTRGWGLHCINATTGEGVWNITGLMAPGSVADGYLTAGNGYDGYMYVFGKGQSQTTVTAPDVVVSLGNGVVIKGTVTDLSPAQPGTPCVSKDSMATQMEYLHMQHPVDGLDHNVTMTGVPVTLTAIDSTGSCINVGTATTNAYYGTFEMAWTPTAEGTYQIIASFAGDDSYGSSAAATAISVGPAPTTPETPEIPTPVDNTMLLYGILAAVVIAIILAIVAILVVLRKR